MDLLTIAVMVGNRGILLDLTSCRTIGPENKIGQDSGKRTLVAIIRTGVLGKYLAVKEKVTLLKMGLVVGGQI